MASGLILPAGVKRAHGRDRWPPPDVLTLTGGALLKHYGEWVPIATAQGKVYRGPHDLTVIVSMDAFIHGVVKHQRHVFHVTEMPQAWPKEGF